MTAGWRTEDRRCPDCGITAHEFRPDWIPGPVIKRRPSRITWRCTRCGLSGRSHDPRTTDPNEVTT